MRTEEVSDTSAKCLTLPRFLATQDVGRLARWLRLMGYDTADASARPLPTLYQRAHNEGRMIVTRDSAVVGGSLVWVIRVRSQELEEQLRQVIDEAKLTLRNEAMFTRCDICNVPVQAVDKARVEDRIPPYVAQTQTQFRTCPSCQRVYWAATHWQRARTLFERLTHA